MFKVGIVIVVLILFIFKKQYTLKKKKVVMRKPDFVQPLPKPKSKNEMLRDKIISKFEKSDLKGKYVRNFQVTDISGRTERIELALLTTKGLLVIKTLSMCIQLFGSCEETMTRWPYYKSLKKYEFGYNFNYDNYYFMENPLISLKEKIKVIENIDFKYKFYFEPLVVFDSFSLVFNMESVKTTIGLDYVFNKLSEEEDFYPEERIEYLYSELMKRKFQGGN